MPVSIRAGIQYRKNDILHYNGRAVMITCNVSQWGRDREALRFLERAYCGVRWRREKPGETDGRVKTLHTVLRFFLKEIRQQVCRMLVNKTEAVDLGQTRHLDC